MTVEMATLISMLLQVMFTKKKTETGTKLGTSEVLKDLKVKKDKMVLKAVTDVMDVTVKMS